MLAASSAVVVAAGIAACSYALASGGPAGPVSCAPTQGLFRVFVDDGECVGVTDGSYDFDPGSSADQRNIAAVERLIAGQNGWVTTNYKSDYVTVALLTPLTEPAPGATPSDVTLSRIDDELRGAYLAVYYANHEGQTDSVERHELVAETERFRSCISVAVDNALRGSISPRSAMLHNVERRMGSGPGRA